ncbi:bifunctional diguanylate cyclase/phosphodiesterase [Actinoplanes sp. NPDC026619]|uniref:putative bifunctional diguanylate cyclase/phosphodiesterase n=1 Tax=Actinoplanes sp. NPDC026619 TaxID=3155798 RepID=UPI00340C025B
MKRTHLADRIVLTAAGGLLLAALLGVLGLVLPIPVWSLWPVAAFALAAGVAGCAVAAATASGPGRAFWQRIAFATVLLDVAVIVHAVDAVRQPGRVLAMTTRGEVLYMAAIGLAVVALLLLPGRRRGRRTAAALWLDVAVVVVAAVVVLKEMLAVLPFQLTGGRPATAFQLMTAATALAAVLAVIKVGMSGSGPVAGRALWILSPVGLLGPLATVLAPALRPWPHLSPIAFNMLIFAMILTLATRAQTRANLAAPTPPPSDDTVRRRPISLVPYAAVAVTAVMLVGVTVRDGYLPAGLATGAIVLILLVVVRQHAALLDNGVLLDRLVDQVRHDDLTGLSNRRGFTGTLADRRAPAVVAVCDLDNFAAINDRLGDATGDAVLREAAHRITLTVGGSATVARLLGDEFGVLLSVEDGAQLAEALRDAFHAPLSVDGHDLLVTVSVGFATGAGDAIPDLLRRAELALQAAKRVGAGRCLEHTAGLDATVQHDAQLAADLRRGLEDGEFRLAYQPIVELPTGAMRAVEALVRWRMSPAEFIPVAEQTGLIIDLGAWILDTACADAAAWYHRYGADAPAVSVNVSARQLLDPDLPALVAATMHRHGLPADRLILEITETAVFAGGPALATVGALRDLGVGIALDDFGTGHSSLTLLRTCPVTTLKVDKSFIDDLNGSPQQEAIAVSLRGIADTLGLRAVAEGVETQAQAERLHALGYRYAQGFFFARPAPASDIEKALTSVSTR